MDNIFFDNNNDPDYLKDRIGRVLPREWKSRFEEFFYQARLQDPKNPNYDTLTSVFYDLELIFSSLSIGFDWRNPLWRARINIGENENQNVKGTFSYPPKKNAKIGRANKPGAPLFYCSLHPKISLLELRPKSGDLVYMSKWVVKPSIANKKIFTRPFLKLSNTQRHKNLFRGLENFARNSSSGANNISENFIQAMFAFEEEFLSDNIVFSSWYGDHLLGSNAKHIIDGNDEIIGVDGIMYPSVPGKLYGENVCFKTKTIDSSFELEQVHVFQYLQNDRQKSNSEFRIELRSIGYYNGKRLQWRVSNEGLGLNQDDVEQILSLYKS